MATYHGRVDLVAELQRKLEQRLALADGEQLVRQSLIRRPAQPEELAPAYAMPAADHRASRIAPTGDAAQRGVPGA